MTQRKARALLPIRGPCALRQQSCQVRSALDSSPRLGGGFLFIFSHMNAFDQISYKLFPPVLTTESMRALDAATKGNDLNRGYSLMKEAGQALFLLVKSKSPKSVAVFVGGGNNGGDGLVLAARLLENGIPCTTYSLAPAEKFKNEAKMALDEFLFNGGKLQEVPTRLCGFDLIVDCMLGNGASGELRPNFADAVQLIQESGIPVIAADAPTGYDSATHLQTGTCLTAKETILFGFPRIDAYVKEGGLAFGKTTVASLSYPKEVVEKFDSKTYLVTEEVIPHLLPKRSEWDDKRTQGCAMVIAGSKDMTGAATLCTEAALRSGTGLVTLAIPQTITQVLQAKLSEPVFCSLNDEGLGQLQPGNVPVLLQKVAHNDAIAIGPGLGSTNATKETILEFLSKIDDRPVVIDADGLNAIATEPSILQAISVPAVLTPHRREYARLFGSLPEKDVDIPDQLRQNAKATGKVILLKGAPTFIACPDGRVYMLPVANSGMAKGGSGDVLSGIIVALLAQGQSVDEAAVLGALLHQKAGRIAREKMGAFSMLPSDVIANLPAAFAEG